jgi:hypothetical protein
VIEERAKRKGWYHRTLYFPLYSQVCRQFGNSLIAKVYFRLGPRVGSRALHSSPTNLFGSLGFDARDPSHSRVDDEGAGRHIRTKKLHSVSTASACIALFPSVSFKSKAVAALPSLKGALALPRAMMLNYRRFHGPPHAHPHSGIRSAIKSSCGV